MYKKMLILLLAGFCTVFFVVGSVGYYIQSFAENESFRLGKEFEEKYSDEIWLRSKNHTMEYIGFDCCASWGNRCGTGRCE